MINLRHFCPSTKEGGREVKFQAIRAKRRESRLQTNFIISGGEGGRKKEREN